MNGQESQEKIRKTLGIPKGKLYGGWHILVLETNDNSVSDEDYWKEEE